MKQIQADIKAHSFKPVYLLYGEEQYLVKQMCAELAESIAGGDMSDMNRTVFSGKGVSAEQIYEAAESMPFFSDYRVIVVEYSGLFSAGRKETTDAVSKIIENIPDSSVVIFTEENADKRLSLYKAVNKYGYCAEFAKMKSAELGGWLSQKSNGKLSGQGAEFMIRYVGADMTILSSELDKLLSYVGERAISRADIENVCTRSLESSIFTMVAAIGNKNPQVALDVYNNLLIKKESPLGILMMIARQLRMIMQCKYLSAKGGNAKQIAAELKLRDFMVRDCLEQSRNFNVSGLMRALMDCADCDIRIKRGLIEDRLAVESFILQYSR